MSSCFCLSRSLISPMCYNLSSRVIKGGGFFVPRRILRCTGTRCTCAASNNLAKFQCCTVVLNPPPVAQQKYLQKIYLCDWNIITTTTKRAATIIMHVVIKYNIIMYINLSLLAPNSLYRVLSSGYHASDRALGEVAACMMLLQRAVGARVVCFALIAAVGIRRKFRSFSSFARWHVYLPLFPSQWSLHKSATLLAPPAPLPVSTYRALARLGRTRAALTEVGGPTNLVPPAHARLV